MALVYSCCLWFSLRLGGIIIGIFSLGVFLLICSCLAYAHAGQVKEEINKWTESINFVYSNEYLEQIITDPTKFISLFIAFICIYIISCILYIYGAYIFNNFLMLSFIILELVRLICVTMVVATSLLLLKENTMDIGILIAASVVAGFFLLGMFYLWVCVANLPILINEMERDEQAATIAKLQQILESNQNQNRRDGILRYGDVDITRPMVVGSRNRQYGVSTISRP